MRLNLSRVFFCLIGVNLLSLFLNVVLLHKTRTELSQYFSSVAIVFFFFLSLSLSLSPRSSLQCSFLSLSLFIPCIQYSCFLFSLSLSLSLVLFVLSLYLSIYLSIYLSLSLCCLLSALCSLVSTLVSLSTLSFSLSLSLSFCHREARHSLCLSFFLCLTSESLWISLNLSPSLPPSLHLSRFFIFLPLSLSLCSTCNSLSLHMSLIRTVACALSLESGHCVILQPAVHVFNANQPMRKWRQMIHLSIYLYIWRRNSVIFQHSMEAKVNLLPVHFLQSHTNFAH